MDEGDYKNVFRSKGDSKNINVKTLRKRAKSFLKSAEILLKEKDYENAIYLCGYYVEVSLKITICKRLYWNSYPPSELSGQLQKYLKTHNLADLMWLSGKMKSLTEKGKLETDKEKPNLLLNTKWKFILNWGEEMRYQELKITKKDAENFISFSKDLVRFLNK